MQLLLAVLMVLASCGADEATDSTAPSTAAPTATTPSPPTTSGQDTVLGSTTSTEQMPDAVGSMVLRQDGLGVVAFGQPADEVVRILGELVGSPPTDPGDEAEWVEFIGWSEHGLYLGFDTPGSSEFDGVRRFVGWDYSAPGGLGLVTDEGVGIGSTLSEVRAAYGDRLEIPAEPDDCVGDWTYWLNLQGGEVELGGTLDRRPADDAQIASAHAGVAVGC